MSAWMKVELLLACVALGVASAGVLFVSRGAPRRDEVDERVVRSTPNERVVPCEAELVAEPEPSGWREWSGPGGAPLEFEETHRGWRVTPPGTCPTEGLAIERSGVPLPLSPCPRLRIHSRGEHFVVGETAAWLSATPYDVEQFLIAFRRIPRGDVATGPGPRPSGVSKLTWRLLALGVDLIALVGLVLAWSRARRHLLAARQIRDPLCYAVGVRGPDGVVQVPGVGSLVRDSGGFGLPGPVLVRLGQATPRDYRTPPSLRAASIISGTRDAACARCMRNARRFLVSVYGLIAVVGFASCLGLQLVRKESVDAVRVNGADHPQPLREGVEWRGPAEQISCHGWHPDWTE
jgi:hypothetical protein